MHQLGAVLRDSCPLVFAADDEPRDVLKEDERDRAQIAELDEMSRLQRRLREQHAVVGDDADQEAVQPGKPGDERGPVALLELVETGSVDEPSDDLAHIVWLARVGVDDAVDLSRVVQWFFGRAHVRRERLHGVEGRHNRPAHLQRLLVVFREVVGYARESRVHVGAAELFRRHLLAGRGFDERGTAQEDRAGALDDDGFVGHCRHVGAARRARAHDRSDLRDALRGHSRLVEEDAAEMIAIGEHLRLERQVRAAGIDQVDAGQAVLQRNLLRAHVLLHRHGKVRPALHGGVVGDDHHLAARDAADAGDDARRRRIVVVHVGSGQRGQLEKGRAGIQEALDTLADGQLALRAVTLEILGTAAFSRAAQPIAQLGDELPHAFTVGLESGVGSVDAGVQRVHGRQSCGGIAAAGTSPTIRSSRI